MIDPRPRASAARELVAELTAIGQTVATAESLTAGLLAATIADVPGASSVLRGGLIVYATDLKHTLAGVSDDVLAADGPVAPTTARELARGAALRCGADWGVSLTGVAGPDRQNGVPVGTVFLGIRAPEGQVEAIELHLAGDRGQIRTAAAAAAIAELRRRLATRRE